MKIPPGFSLYLSGYPKKFATLFRARSGRRKITSIANFGIILSSSVFYIGYSLFLAGTMASLAAFLVDIVIIKANVVLHLGIVCCSSLIGFLVSGKAEKLFGQKDAREIVIDDFNGALVGLLFIPHSLKISIFGFIIFRIMDGLKPYPIYKMEKLKGSWGVMGDDLVAGIYTNIVLQLLCALLA